MLYTNNKKEGDKMSVNINFPNFIEVNELDTSDATATENDIAVGKTAYVNGVKVTGTKEDAVQNVVWVDNVSGTLEGIHNSSGNYASKILDFVKEINIPNGITGINASVFRECLSLKSITIPDSVTFIGNHAFKSCFNLENIYYKGTEEQWNAITKGTDWNDSMGYYVGGTVIHYNS